jgi:hypothetical protein
VVADSPDVGAFHEFEVKHMAGSRTRHGGDPGRIVMENAFPGFSKILFNI